ncbi:hypothetical protein ASE14_10640 [Agromyces sp. Root81]|uniref:hypothetical protein n=1 Tax=Agromyces sp. Root81 TaxID=1736601 RepID=UPI0006FBD4A5|nr:hypothetical protein [Agromyces sp. Root81]KRC61341.1 hypothetical protein ASE14_10640 [Agromyces sp. Root81]
MTRTAYEAQPRDRLLDGIAEEFLHNAPHGRRLIAVEGAASASTSTSASADAARFADDLAAALTAHGQSVVRATVGNADEAALRADTIEPFRAAILPGASDDAVLVVDGRGLLDGGARGIWHFSLWLLAGDELPHSGASVIVDVTEPGTPRRFFYDYCALPPSANRAGLS